MMANKRNKPDKKSYSINEAEFKITLKKTLQAPASIKKKKKSK
jgi:hypothetical protein